MDVPHLEFRGEPKSSPDARGKQATAAPHFAAAELRRRRSFTILLAFLSWFGGLFSSVVHLQAGNVERAFFTGSYGFLIVGCLAGLWLGRRRPEPVAHTILAFTAIGMLVSPSFAPEAIAVPLGLMTIPISAILTLGYRGGCVWTALAALSLVGLGLLAPIGVAERTLVWNTVIMVVLIGGVGAFIDRQRTRAEIDAEIASALALDESESRLRTESSLAEREAFLATVFRRTPAVLILVELPGGRIVEVNERFTHLLGWERDEAVGKTLSELGAWFDENDMQRLGQVMVESEGFETIESRLADRRGQPIDLLASVETLVVDGQPHWLVHAVDIRDRKRVEDRLLHDLRVRLDEQDLELMASRERLEQQEQLASVGTLAAGIAHQINNPVGGIRTIAETTRMEIEDGTADERSLAEALDRIVGEASRCGDIVRSILQFSRNEPMSRWPGDLNEAVDRSVRLMRPRLSRDAASIQARLCGDKLSVSMNPVAIDQILTNLVENAVLTSEGPVEVRITTERRDHSGVITISDDGPGMEPAVLERAFDPFFTTRLDRGGTGLGLSVVHGLVRDLGGDIEIASDEGEGVCVEIALPLIET